MTSFSSEIPEWSWFMVFHCLPNLVRYQTVIIQPRNSSNSFFPCYQHLNSLLFQLECLFKSHGDLVNKQTVPGRRWGLRICICNNACHTFPPFSLSCPDDLIGCTLSLILSIQKTYWGPSLIIFLLSSKNFDIPFITYRITANSLTSAFSQPWLVPWLVLTFWIQAQGPLGDPRH